MTMKRTDLLTKLERVSPALAPNDLIPVMTRYWFTGHTLVASSGQVTIVTPLATDFVGSLPKHVVALLSASRAADLTITQDNSTLLIQAARARFKLDLNPQDEFEPFLSVLPPAHETLSTDKEALKLLREALQSCMRAVSGDTARPEHLGVTVAPLGDGIGLYATSGTTIAHVALPTLDFVDYCSEQVILPKLFCDQACRFLRTAESAALTIANDHAHLTTDSVSLVSQLIESERPLDFESVISRYWPEGGFDAFIEIPNTFRLTVERAAIIADTKISRTPTTVKVKDGRASLRSASDRGEVQELVRFDNHPNLQTNINSKLIKEGLEGANAMLITEQCTLLANREHGHVYMVAAMTD